MTWSTVKLADLATVTSGGGAPQDADAFSAEGTPFVRAGSLVRLLDGQPEESLELLQADVAAGHRLKLFPAGTVLFAKSGMSATKGHIYQLKKPAYVVNHLAALVPRSEVSGRYLRQVLKLKSPTCLIKDEAYPSIRLGDIESMEVPAPKSESERERIVAILDEADELRRKRQRALDRLNQLGQSIFHEMFGDITTNPMGWSTVNLGDACGVGSSKRVFVDEFVDEGVPFYRGTEVGKLATGDLIEPDLFIAPNHYAELIAHSGKPEIGDLLLPSICHDGRIWRVDSEKPFYFKDGRVLWIKQNEAVFDSDYLQNHLRNAFLTNYHTIASGTTFAELKIVNLRGLSVLCPPLNRQVEFSKRIREVEKTRFEVIKSASVASVLFASLQHRAFRGEL